MIRNIIAGAAIMAMIGCTTSTTTTGPASGGCKKISIVVKIGHVVGTSVRIYADQSIIDDLNPDEQDTLRVCDGAALRATSRTGRMWDTTASENMVWNIRYWYGRRGAARQGWAGLGSAWHGTARQCRHLVLLHLRTNIKKGKMETLHVFTKISGLISFGIAFVLHAIGHKSAAYYMGLAIWCWIV